MLLLQSHVILCSALMTSNVLFVFFFIFVRSEWDICFAIVLNLSLFFCFKCIVFKIFKYFACFYLLCLYVRFLFCGCKFYLNARVNFGWVLNRKLKNPSNRETEKSWGEGNFWWCSTKCDNNAFLVLPRYQREWMKVNGGKMWFEILLRSNFYRVSKKLLPHFNLLFRSSLWVLISCS